MSDPAWLYSTVAQSTAALVAIVGGFLVSRLITLSSERANLATVLRELKEVESKALSEVARIDDSLKGLEVQLVLDAELPAMLEARGGGDPAADVLERHQDLAPDVRLEDFELPHAGRAYGIANAFEQLGPLVSESANLPDDAIEGLRQIGIEDGAVLEEISAWTAVYRYLANAERKDRDLPKATPDPLVGYNQISYTHLQSEREPARQRATQATATRERADFDLRRLAKPQSLGFAFTVLLYFAVAGLVLPVVVLLREPPSDWAVIRAAVVAGFTTGLAGLLWFLWRVIREATATDRT